jgi:hypothetical protein
LNGKAQPFLTTKGKAICKTDRKIRLFGKKSTAQATKAVHQF